jgi:hypothetical protein
MLATSAFNVLGVAVSVLALIAIVALVRRG